MKDKYILGIIGGMGPLATSYFFDQIVTHTKAESDNEHMNCVILNHASMVSRVEAAFDENKKQQFLSQIKKDFEYLENIGVQNIAIPCNGAHSFFDELEKMTNINIINMPRETVKDILEKSKSSFSKGEDRDEAIKKVGVLCTDATIKSEIYKKELEKNNIEIVYPDEVFQKDLMEIIYKEIKKNGNLNIERFAKIINHMQEKGSDVIILACTELSLFKNYYEVKETCVDAMNSLVKKSIELSGKEFQKPVYNYSIKEIFKKVLRIAELKIKKSFK
jgi:aspartate racemase